MTLRIYGAVQYLLLTDFVLPSCLGLAEVVLFSAYHRDILDCE